MRRIPLLGAALLTAPPLLLGATPWPLPSDVRVCGAGGPAQIAMATHLSAPAPPPGVRDLRQQWSIARIGDVVVMRDITGEQLDSGFTYDAMADAIDTFYQWFDDDYTFVTFLTNQDASRSMGALAFYAPNANDVRGIGLPIFRGGTLEGLIFMNAWQYWSGGSDTLTSAVFGQELGHRWGAYVGYDLGDGVATDTLGRDDGHWSYWLETSNSPMEGNAWVDAGDGSFRLDAEEEIAYSDLDLYLMGLIAPEEVEPFFLIQDPAGLDRSAGSAPEYYASGRDQTATGFAQEITIEDVILAEGERDPAVGESPTDFNMVVVLILGRDEVPTADLLGNVEDVGVRFAEVWEEDTLNLATLDATPGAALLPAFDPATLGGPVAVPRNAW